MTSGENVTGSDDAKRVGGTNRAVGGRTLRWALIALALVAIAGTTLAFFGSADESPISGFRATGSAEPVAPPGALPENAHRIVIERRDETIRMERRESGWAMAGTGYLADDARIVALLESLQKARLAYVSTAARPSLTDYSVADPAAPFAPGTRMAIRDESGTDIVDLVVGSQRTPPQDADVQYTFVRRNGDDRVWLADVGLKLPVQPLEWVDTRIVDVPRETVVAYEARSPQGGRIAVRRDPDGALQVTAGLASPDEVEGPWVLDGLAGALEDVRFIDVAPVGHVFGDADAAWRTVIQTGDGVAYRIDVIVRDEPIRQAWARFSAAAVDDEPASGPAAGNRTIAAFNARHEGWAYAVPPLTGDQLTRSADNLVQ